MVNQHTLTYLAGANGSITGINAQVVTHGGSGTAVTAVPDTDYHFVDWSDGSTANPRTDTSVTADIAVTANFETIPYTLTYTAGDNGSLTGDTAQVVNHGDNGTAVAAVPDAGYHFVDWSDGSTANPRTDTSVTADIAVTANFEIISYTLRYTAGADGSLTGTSSQIVAHGGSGTAITAVPATGYNFFKWSDGSTANPRTDTSVTADITVTAFFAFKPSPPALTPLAPPSGAVTDSRPLFQWSGASWTSWCEIYIRKVGGWDWSTWIKGSTSWRPTACEFGPGEYKWWVRGWSIEGGYDKWSREMSFSVLGLDHPVPTAPSGTATEARPHFTWDGGSWATWYEIFIRKEGSWDWSTWVQEKSWSPTDWSFGSGNYEWWVRGWNTDREYGEWSEGMRFSVAGAMPSPISPSGTVVGRRPLFMWSGIDWATWYEVFIRKQGAWDWGLNWVQGSTSWVTEYAGQPYDLPSGNYEWWVRGWSIGNGYGVWSSGLPFTVVPLPPPPPGGW